MKFDWKAHLPVADFHPIIFFQRRHCFFVVDQHCCKATFFKISRLKLQKLLKSCYSQVKRKVNCGELCVELTLLGLPHIVIDRLWNMAKSTRKNKFHPCVLFKSESDNCHQHFRWLRDNLIMSQHVGYKSSSFIPAEAVENDQEHLVAIR